MPFGLRRREPPADGGWQRIVAGPVAYLLSKGGATGESIAAAEAGLGTRLPPSLAAFIGRADAAEGWVGGDWLAMWPVAQLADLNRRARVGDFAPSLAAFATNGGGEGYFFDRETGDFRTGPMIGLGEIEATRVGGSLDEVLAWIAAQSPAPAGQPAPATNRFGQVIYEKTPILFGGDPVDPANKAWLTLADYAAVVAWWNELLRSQGEFPAGGQSGD